MGIHAVVFKLHGIVIVPFVNILFVGHTHSFGLLTFLPVFHAWEEGKARRARISPEVLRVSLKRKNFFVELIMQAFLVGKEAPCE